jgi:plastocyanin
MSGVIFVDVQETQRALESTIGKVPFIDVKIEMPQGAAYNNNYGPYFIPSYGIIPLGAKVTWTNHDYITHTATATDGTFDTQAIEPGQSKTVIIQNNPATIAYYCKIHPWMQATLRLTESTSLPPNSSEKT